MQDHGYGGRGGGRNGRVPAPVEDSPPPTLGTRLNKLRKDARTTGAGLPRALRLVWESGRGYTVALAVLTVLGGIVPTATAWISKLLIDAVVAAVRAGGSEATRSAVIGLVALQFAVFVGTALLNTVRNINQQALQELTARRVQLLLMDHANRLDLSFFENPEFYDKLQEAQREAGYRPVGMVEQLFGLVRSAITFLSMIALIARLGPWVAAAALIAPIPSFIAQSRYGWQGYMMSRRQSPDRRLMSYLLDLVTKDTYNKEIKLFGLGDYFIARWRTISERFYRENRSLVVRRYLMGFLWGSLSTVVTSATYGYVALQAVVGRLTLGDLTFYSQAVGQVQSSLSGILSGLSDLYENSLYLTNLFDFLDYVPAIQRPADPLPLARPLQGGIEFRHVSFTYPGKDTPALRDVSFTIASGESVALVGLNGAGKTTIVKLLTRLYDPDSGQILLDGHDLRDYDPADVRAVVGVIFQDYATYFFSARENIGLGRLADVENLALVEASAAKSGADAVVARLPKGYDTTLGRWFDEGTQLSGGEWQKVALARAFMRDAEILVLDEPTASLDARAEYDIFTRMRELTRGKMTLFISHRFSTVRLADRIFVLDNGMISEAGTHADLLAAGGIYADLFNLQAAAYR